MSFELWAAGAWYQTTKENPQRKKEKKTVTMKKGLEGIGPGTPGRPSSSWKQLTLNGYPSLRPIKRPFSYGRLSRIYSTLTILLLSTPNSPPFWHCEQLQNQTFPPPLPNSIPSGLASTLAAPEHEAPTSSLCPTTSRTPFAPRMRKPHSSSIPSPRPCPTSRNTS